MEDKPRLLRTNFVCGGQTLSVEDKLHKLHLVIKKDAVQQPMTVSLFSISFVYNNHCYFVITSCLKNPLVYVWAAALTVVFALLYYLTQNHPYYEVAKELFSFKCNSISIISFGALARPPLKWVILFKSCKLQMVVQQFWWVSQFRSSSII